MPKWNKYVLENEDDAEVTPSFEKFDKRVKNGRRLLKLSDEEILEKKQREKERDEERAAKRGDEV